MRFWAFFARIERIAVQEYPVPMRLVRMDATALNDRRGSGMRCRGFLGRPTVVMLG